MSDAPSGKSHTATWTLLFLAIPLLYILTVPVVKYAVVRPQWMSVSGPGIKTTHIWATTTRWPDWLKTYCAPYEWLVRQTPLGPPLRSYQEWWFKLAQ